MQRYVLVTSIAGLLLVISLANAQPPQRGQQRSTPESTVARLFAFDTNNDGKLTKDEVTDSRLTRLFDRADADKDGTLTQDEFAVLIVAETIRSRQTDKEYIAPVGGPGGPPGGGPGRPPGGGPGGPPGGLVPPRPGQVLPPFIQEMLNLTDKQRKQLDELQKDVDRRLERILTDEQKQQLDEFQPGPGPGGPPGDTRPEGRDRQQRGSGERRRPPA